MSASHSNSRKKHQKSSGTPKLSFVVNILSVGGAVAFVVLACFGAGCVSLDVLNQSIEKTQPPPPPKLDKRAYDARMLALSRGEPYAPFVAVPIHATSSSTLAFASSTATGTTSMKETLWHTKTVYPNYGAIFPFNRVVAYYGNFYSTKMGVLGEYPREEMLSKLKAEVSKWQIADPTTPVIPAIDYIAVTAQASAGKDGMYRLRMPDSQIDKALSMAKEVHGVLILDVQVGLSTLQKELPLLEKYLKKPNVELAIDPEFSMTKSKRPPGTVIGTYSAEDINYASSYLARLVRLYRLPPKFLIVHRFTEAMVTDYKKIKPLPEVQIVIDMDGWGSPARKLRTYKDVIFSEPVQFTGFKLFYKNDAKYPSTHMLTPKEVLRLAPRPIFIQYQ